MDDLCDMNLESFKLWSFHALKIYLSKRNLDVNGTFDELSARAFCAWEQNIQVDENAQCSEMRLLQEYADKMEIENEILPDPVKLRSGWKGENIGLNMWPSIYITDISAYIDGTAPSNVIHKLMNEYKLGKAYRYFENGWVREVYYHDISDTSDKCFLKAKVTPSQNLNSACYNVWVCVRKDKCEKPGGEILSAYCTCTAGMYGTCNHIAGVLFRCEYAVKTGETKKSSTSKSSTWVIPKGKPLLKPAKANEVAWKKGHFLKTPHDHEEEKRKAQLKRTFTPMSKQQNEDVKDLITMRKTLYSLIIPEVGDSCFCLLHDGRRIENITPVLPKTMKEIAQSVTCQEDFRMKMKLTDDDIENVRKETVNQSESKVWHDQREGRITASNFKRVCTRVDTLRKDSNVDLSSLKKTLLGQQPNIQTAAMKHGISLESSAKKNYTKEMIKTHKKFKAKDTGLKIDKENTFLAASADLETSCVCCGQGLCEIKCPESVKDQKPSPSNVPYLIEEDNCVTLDKKDRYYYQIQGQLAICGKEFCDLFVFTYHGNVIVRVIFDDAFWESAKEKLCWFWLTHILPSLMATGSDENNIIANENQQADVNVKTPEAPEQEKTINPPARRALLSIENNSGNKRKATTLDIPVKSHRKKSVQQRKPVYLCGVCSKKCLDFPERECDQSICCDKCEVWVHYDCAYISEEAAENIDIWICAKCTK